MCCCVRRATNRLFWPLLVMSPRSTQASTGCSTHKLWLGGRILLIRGRLLGVLSETDTSAESSSESSTMGGRRQARGSGRSIKLSKARVSCPYIVVLILEGVFYARICSWLRLGWKPDRDPVERWGYKLKSSQHHGTLEPGPGLESTLQQRYTKAITRMK